jgi:hypothetical protein
MHVRNGQPDSKLPLPLKKLLSFLIVIRLKLSQQKRRKLNLETSFTLLTRQLNIELLNQPLNSLSFW